MVSSDSMRDQRQELVVVYYVTGHGFGHATRVVEVARHLVAAGHVVYIVSGAPDFVFKREIPSPKLHVRKVLLDCGAVQSDALTVDRQASLEQYSETAVLPRASILETESRWLRSINANLVVSDIVPVACRAATEADIPSICVSNFSWDFIYADYVTAAGHAHQSIIWQIAEDYSQALFLVRLPGYLPAFRDVVDVPLVVREVRKSREQVRKEFGIPDDKKIVVFNFGGQLANWSLKEEFLPAGWVCLVCGASPDQSLPPNFIGPGRDAYTPDLIAASDCMLGKIGYGTVSEALGYKVPFVFIRRDYFNEEPFLRNMLESYRCGVEMIRRDFLSGQWEPYLQRALQMKPCYDLPLNGGETVARILEGAARGDIAAVRKESGARRLRDAIVFGYQIQRVPGREVTIPDWYTQSQSESQLGLLNGLNPGVPGNLLNHTVTDIEVEEFEILHGDLQGLSDTALFLKSLARLKDDVNSPLRERVAAAGIFSWEEEIFVARAPGRLDVMGGIADYSGSLVLQMPIREACHVAVQRNSSAKQRVWKHISARQVPGCKPVMQIVSLGSEASNRAPTFDMDLSDFFDAQGEPISYEEARRYFSNDSSQRSSNWAAYVAGTILVLIRELGFKCEDCISILVSSAVPEGKGVSSSAAVEVASMSAIAAAYGLEIEPRQLAILCQKVENLIVGAPCGVMDQMTSACGEAYKLLAMVCQPAEVKEHVNIPTDVKFWGLDSGIKHSVGGADYGSVRVGAFMGRQMIAQLAAEKLSEKQDNGNGFDEVDEVETEQLLDEKNLSYLCNLTTERYEASYANMLPETIEGKKFLDKYGSHKDSVTTILPQVSYPVKSPTAHPIYENSRVEAFALLLEAAGDTTKQLYLLGQLMYQAHLSYTKCGLGSTGTDRLVALVKHMQRHSTSENTCLFGAKISGGGCGGTVCVVSTPGVDATKQILEVQQRYKEATGHLPFIFEGSSPGAGKFGHLRIIRKSI
ncbi:L-arabinokinase isoform X2 [Selaginella moellendorffii]|uniref:L-arabinokinase isoform X2 n=1 Tax=Selaginella moellendorffii TaxID=88036 RepID=UPI000D1C8B0F|nr:L-arabinokinase isoform X2 [Selaginella moellendorffii]|eukprot:XP_024537180.1 L-arabinokinase isoform X2 [Selaginella moellendorffii]